VPSVGAHTGVGGGAAVLEEMAIREIGTNMRIAHAHAHTTLTYIYIPTPPLSSTHSSTAKLTTQHSRPVSAVTFYEDLDVYATASTGNGPHH